MPKATLKQPKLVYPSGVKDITHELSTDDLVRRLKVCRLFLIFFFFYQMLFNTFFKLTV